MASEAYSSCCGDDVIPSSTRRYLLSSNSHRHLVFTWDLVLERKLRKIGLKAGYLRDLQRLQKDLDALSEKAAVAIQHMQAIPLWLPNTTKSRSVTDRRRSGTITTVLHTAAGIPISIALFD